VITRTKKFGATVLASAMLAAGALAPTAGAQPPIVIGGGLVNVVVNDVTILEDVKVGVAAAVAANVCGVNVAVLAQDLQFGDATCTSDTGDVVVIQAD
jgi:hypothetical protein